MFKILPRRPQSKYETPSELHLPPCSCALGLWVRGSQPYSVPASFVLPFFSEGLPNSLPCYTIQGIYPPPAVTNNYPDIFAPEPSLSPLTVLLLLTIHLPAFCVLGVLGIWGSLASPFLLCWFPLAFLLPALFSSVAGTLATNLSGLSSTPLSSSGMTKTPRTRCQLSSYSATETRSLEGEIPGSCTRGQDEL